MERLTSVINFFCLGYAPDRAGEFLGLDRWSLGHLCAVLAEEAALGDDDRALALKMRDSSFEPYSHALRTLGPEWFMRAEQLLRLAHTAPEVSHLAYHFVASVPASLYSVGFAEAQAAIQKCARERGFDGELPRVGWLGYDLVEPHSYWSVLTHAEEWSGIRYAGNIHQLCHDRAAAEQLLASYGVAEDAFMLPLEEYAVVALYDVWRMPVRRQR